MGKDCNWILVALAIVAGVHVLGAAEPTARPKRDQIGTVLGKPVYRNELRTTAPAPSEEDELHRLFLDPLLEKYIAAHQAELEVTPAELATVETLLEKHSKPKPLATPAEIKESLQRVNEELRKKRSEFSRAYLEQSKRDLEGMLRGEIPVPLTEDQRSAVNSVSVKQLKQVNAQLARPNLPLLERVSLTFDKWSLEQQITHPFRMVAAMLYGNWKLQRHFYDHFGGGRVLWQQAGYEAFDAYRRWLESEERQGNFKINDPKMRQVFYRYWQQSHAPFLFSDAEQIRSQFLEPDWVPRPAAR